MELLIVCASNGKNLELANQLSQMAEELNIQNEVVDLIDCNLKLYDPSSEAQGLPNGLEELATKFKKADSLIFLAPEYNGSTPPVFNNAIAWISRSSKDWREAFNGKPCAIGTHSGGGGLHVLMAMRMQLSFIGMKVLGRQIHTHFSKELNADTAKAVLNSLKNS